MEINSTHMTFNWSPVFSTCNTIHYLIISSNCGHCANVTNNTTVTCHNNIIRPLTNDPMCTFAVRSVVCNNIVGNESRRVQVALRSKFSYLLNLISFNIINLKEIKVNIINFNNIMFDEFDNYLQCSSQCSSDQCHPNIFTQN